jgi:hypothetical protein
MAQHVERQFLEGGLVFEIVGHGSDVHARLCLDFLTHHVDAFAGALGDRIAGERLAQHQRQRGRKRHLRGFGGARDRIGRRAHLDRRCEIGADARIAGRAQSFVAGLFDRVVTGARDRLARGAARMDPLVVMAQPQRETVRKTARLPRLIVRQRAARQGNAEVLARLRRAIRAPGDFDLILTRQGAGRAGQGLLETVEGRLFGHVWKITGSTDPFPPNPSGSLRSPCR